MNEKIATALLYAKENCPFCLKVRLFLLESGLAHQVEIMEFSPGSPEEAIVRGAVTKASGDASFPTLKLPDGVLIQDSDAIVAHFAAAGRIDPADLALYTSYTKGVMPKLRALYTENMDLKQRLNT